MDQEQEDEKATRRAATGSPFQAGDMLAGKYRIERELGRGGMGVVLAARHVDLDQQVAVKLLHSFAAEKPDFVARFSREARSAAKIRSDHVARMIDVGTLEDGTAYFVMEHLEGVDLTIDGVPPGTKIYRGVVLIGTVPSVIHLPRGVAKVTLRFTADGYTSADVDVVPDADGRLTVSLVRAPVRSVKPAEHKGSKDLETF